jgi:hypothetical protein
LKSSAGAKSISAAPPTGKSRWSQGGHRGPPLRPSTDYRILTTVHFYLRASFEGGPSSAENGRSLKR